jgi:transposase InsO family protein
MLACDFFTVKTLHLQTLYVLFFVELGSRRVHLAGCTTHPNTVWVTQEARQLVWQLDESSIPMRFLIHDRDSKFTTSFDQVFVSEGIDIVRTPFRAPRVNAVAERWVRSIRQECLDHLLILNQRISSVFSRNTSIITTCLVLIRDSISTCLFPYHVLHKESSAAAMFLAAFCTITIAMLLEFPLG